MTTSRHHYQKNTTKRKWSFFGSPPLRKTRKNHFPFAKPQHTNRTRPPPESEYKWRVYGSSVPSDEDADGTASRMAANVSSQHALPLHTVPLKENILLVALLQNVTITKETVIIIIKKGLQCFSLERHRALPARNKYMDDI